jgi:hypothetical protein
MRRLLSMLLPLCICLTACPTPGGGGDDDDDLTLYTAVDVGALAITEILANPNVGRPEFIEVVNTTGEIVNLQGCRIVDAGAGEHEFNIGADKPVQPGARALLGAAGYLGSSEGEIEVDVVWSDITLAQSDEAESVGLLCPDGTGSRRVIDEVAFHWSGLGLRRGHSWQLDVAADVVLNDDPLNWCEAPTQDDATYAVVDGQPDYGTPGGPTICETPAGPPPGPGDVVISEILIDEFSGLSEWFELYNATDAVLDLRGCELGDAALDAGGDPNIHVLDAELGRTAMEPGEFLLLAKGETVVEDGSLEPDYPYATLGFNNSGAQLLWLDCEPDGGGAPLRVDEIEYDWGDYGSAWEGRSLALSATELDAVANDDPDAWCLADEDDYFWQTEDDEGEPLIARGTPGEPNPPCPVPDPYPQAGELVFTEVMVRSTTAVGHNEEWFEMKHIGSSTVGLAGCVFRNIGGDGIPDDHTIDSPLGGPSVAPGSWPVFVKSSAADSIACGLPAVYEYGTNISFNNDDPEILTLLCPQGDDLVQIDSISFDGGFTSGIPWQLQAGWESAAGNDDPTHWCSNESTAGYTWSCTVEADTNYGTPGGPSYCP